ncbi:MAG: lasso peptide biosynthesis B2 protein [Actinomycetota bacterium]
MRRIHRFAQLPRVEQRLILKAVFLLWGVRIALWALPFRKVNAYVSKRSRSGVANSNAPSLERLAWIMAAAGRMLPGERTCLVRALAGSLLVAGQGYVPTLRLGVARREAGRLDAHAWLECDGRVLVGGGDLHQYAAFPPLPTNGSQHNPN